MITDKDTGSEVHKYFFRKSFESFVEETSVLESLFKKVAGLLKRDFSIFTVKFVKFFRAPFFTEGLWWLLLR